MWSRSFSLHFAHVCCLWQAFLLLDIEAIPKFYFLGNTGLIKCWNVSVGLNLLSTLSNSNSFDVCHFLFSQGCCHLLQCSQSQLPTSDNSFQCFQSFIGICFVFGHVKSLYLEDVFRLPLATLISKIQFSFFF